MTPQASDPPPCLLAYQFATAPAPLQVSGESQDSAGMMNLWISPPPGQTIFCNEIDIGVRVGGEGGDFSTVAPALTPNTTWWVSAGVVMGNGEELGLAPERNMAIFYVTNPSSDHWNIDYQLLFSVTTTAVNPVPGEFEVVVVEYSAADNPDDIVQRRSVYKLRKAPVELYLNNLVSVAASSSDSTSPKTSFTSGEAIKLTWESNGTSFALYAGDATRPIWTGPDTSYTITGGAVRDTTYTVVATMDGKPEAVSVPVMVTITNPTATPRSAEDAGPLTVAHTSTLTGDAHLGSVVVGERLTVSGATRLAGASAPTVTVTGNTALMSATLGATTVTGGVGGVGSVTLASATANALTVNTSLTGLVPRAVTVGTTYTASSDGILTGTVWYPSNAGAEVSTRISGTCGSVGTVYATGGNASPWVTSKEWCMWSSANSFSLPVPRGSTFKVGVDQRFGTGAPTAFAWFPLARNATLQAIDLGPADLALPAGPDPVQIRYPDPRRRVHELIHSMAEIFGSEFTAERRERLTAAVESLVRHRPFPATDGEYA